MSDATWVLVRPLGPHLYVDILASELPIVGEIAVDVTLTSGVVCSMKRTAEWANPSMRLVPMVPYPGETFFNPDCGDAVEVLTWNASIREVQP